MEQSTEISGINDGRSVELPDGSTTGEPERQQVEIRYDLAGCVGAKKRAHRERTGRARNEHFRRKVKRKQGSEFFIDKVKEKYHRNHTSSRFLLEEVHE